ncbi:MAG: 3-methyladenine DNA glycosylase [Rhodopirellula sp.]|nr:3-methyladenine DNA glycosylase [Rhodopirellula sp.]
MNRKLHSEFLETSLGISAQFHAAISECGVLPQQRPTDQPLTTMMCRTIAGQQLSVQAARTIWARVLTDSGTKPFAKYLTSASPSQLQTCGLSRSKARAMKEIATAASLGRLEAKELATFTHRERSQHLMEIWGVGQWTADMIGIFYFSDQDVWPESDITVTKTLQRLIGYRRKTRIAADRFAPQRSLLARYMWKIADATPSNYQAP